ncbi:MAG TPA: hypothetical protein VIQ74_14285 [Gemmatimonadaceae bacterium]
MNVASRRHAPEHAVIVPPVLRRLAGLTAVFALSGCATMWPTFSGVTSAAPDEAYSCALAHAQGLGYKKGTWDESDHSMTVRREDSEASKLLPGEQHQIDVIAARVVAGAGGNGSALSVRAQTLTRRYTRAGWVEDQAPASPGVKEAAKSVLSRCST